jgi:serine/threonine-protein kinase
VPTAVQRLESAGLAVDVGEAAYSDNVAAGLVLGTDPGPGSRVLDGGTVTLTVSLGPEVYELPDLAGKSVDEAQDAIAASSLTYGQATEVWSETVAAGAVIRSNPAAGTVLRPGAVVDLVVSKGRRPIKVGSWVGRPVDRAETVLDKRGLGVEVSEQHHDEVPEGRVISQDPEGGTLFKGETVSLVVSLGPELVEVPDVDGSGVDAATEELEAAGFVVQVERFTPYFGLGFVMRQEAKGEMLPQGSTVTIWVS